MALNLNNKQSYVSSRIGSFEVGRTPGICNRETSADISGSSANRPCKPRGDRRVKPPPLNATVWCGHESGPPPCGREMRGWRVWPTGGPSTTLPNSIGPHTCAKANPVRTDQPHAHRGRDARPKQASMRSHGHGLKWKSGTKREGPLVSISASGSGHAQQAPRGQTSEAPSAQRYCLVWSRKRAAAMRARDERMESLANGRALNYIAKQYWASHLCEGKPCADRSTTRPRGPLGLSQMGSFSSSYFSSSSSSDALGLC